MTYTDLPDQGWVFWPVGKGDSTTVVVDDQTVLQFDLRDMKAAAEDDAVVAAVIDRLAETLPRHGDQPYLKALVVGHHDEDHCAGIKRFLEEIFVDELWVTPRMWHEQAEGLEFAEHATALFAEAQRRLTKTREAHQRGEIPDPRDRIRIVGEHPDEADHPYADLPIQWRLRPGQSIPFGDTLGHHAEITARGPVGADCAQPGREGRNASSMLLRVRLCDGVSTEAKLLLVGDVDHVVLERLFADARAAGTLEALAWDTHVSSHHCSRHAVFGPDADDEEERKQVVLDGLADTALPGARMIASSGTFRGRDVSGDDPPHRIARDAYEEDVVDDDLLCTAEYPTVEDPRPIVFALRPGVGLELVDPADAADIAATTTEAKTLSLSARGDAARTPLLAALGATSSVPPEQRGLPIATSGPNDAGEDDISQAVTTARGRPVSSASSLGFG